MSQIGEGKTGMEALGRLLGGSESKGGRLAARLADGAPGAAQQEFARLMASAQGLVKSGKANGIPQSGATPSPVPSDQLTRLDQALAGLQEKMAQWQQSLKAEGGADRSIGGELQAALDQLAEQLSDMARAAGGAGKAPGQMASSGSLDLAAADSRLSMLEAKSEAFSANERDELDALRQMLSGPDGQTGAQGAPAFDGLSELAAGLEALRETFAGMGGVADQPAALDRVRQQLTSVQETLKQLKLEPLAAGAGSAGQVQALEQTLARLESSLQAGERLNTGQVAENRMAGEWSWRDSNWSRHAGERQAFVAQAAQSTVDGEADDWNGGPVTAALGLVGRAGNANASGASVQDRSAMASWSALAATSTREGRAEADATSATGGQGMGSAFSGLAGGSAGASGSIFSPQPGSAAPAPNPQLPAQLGQQIQWMTSKGVSKASIELRPADLGPLKIAVESHGEETRIALTATNPAAQGMLEQHLPRLREWLQESGLANSEVEISLGEDNPADQALADAEGGVQGQTEQPGGGAGDEAAVTSMAGEEGEGGDGGDLAEGRLVLDLFA